jgi:hypothetical protein
MSKYQVGYRFTVAGTHGHADTEWEVMSREPSGGGGTNVRIRMTDDGFAAHKANIEETAPELLEWGIINNADVRVYESTGGDARLVGLANLLEVEAVRQMYPGAGV